MKKEKRFKILESESVSFTTSVEILVDTKTGVHYLLSGYSGGSGITPLLGADGKPVITLEDVEKDEGNIYQK